ncbi:MULTISPECIES: thymidine phosphorylase [unclassified Variovorax]|uniref:thymidine phosphorylase n=1 Tax=unclassified Variovorax TaxID=663243 RepID=UPI003ECE224C
MLLPAEVIRAKRDRHALSPAQIEAFVRGLTDGSWSEGQIAALAMAILLNGMDDGECVALTRGMTHSGEVLQWPDVPGPVLDKHSTGGVGDKVSLMLAPIVAACGGVVPMISGRGLGHTGGTLDKLESLAGYRVEPSLDALLAVLRDAGCAIVGAGPTLAPADKRLYAIRDVTATVESLPLITASILSKKLAAGLEGLVLDVKVGNGAFMPRLDGARALAKSLVDVAAGAGLRAEALITDMNQVLGRSAGNALEVREAIDFLMGDEREPRLLEVTLALAARLLRLGGLAADLPEARAHAMRALDSGAAAERFARMVSGLGGASDLGQAVRQLPEAPVQCDLPAPQDGVLVAADVRAIGLAIVALGGGRRRAEDRIDPRVGLTQVLPLGSKVRKGEPLARVHAASQADAEAAIAALQAAMRIEEDGTQGSAASDVPAPVICAEITRAP